MSYDAFDLGGEVALVTDGNAGIGYAMAEALALACDVGDEAPVDAAMSSLVARFGRRPARTAPEMPS